MKSKLSDFSGGITDYRFNVKESLAETMDNWIIDRDKSMRVRDGFEFLDIAAPRIPTNVRISNTQDISDTLVYFSNGNAYFNDGGSYTAITGPSGNPAFNEGGVNSQIDITRFGDLYICVDDDFSFPQKFFKDENGILRSINAGLPIVISDPVLTPSSNDGNNYLYAFVYEYEYRIGTTLYLDLGTPRYLTATNAHDSFTGSLDITDYLELTNGVNRNYDTVNIRKRIYRTQNNGTTYYLVGTIDNNVTTYTDNTNDDDITAGEVLYTQGGGQDNDLPPPAKFVASNNNVAFYANVLEGAETKPFRLRFSKIADPDSVPASFFEDFESDITGISAIDDRVVVFTQQKAISLEGTVDDLGRGQFIRRSIGDVNCISNGSLVTTQDFIYWFSESGVYRTNGITYEKLTYQLDESYQTWVDSDDKKRKIFGTYDQVNQRVYWCFNDGAPDNDAFLVYDEINNGFTTFSSGDDFSPTSIIFKDQELIRSDADGYVFVHNDRVFSDLVKSDTLAPADWWNKAIPYEWKHIAWTLGDSERVKWLVKMNVVGRPDSNVYLEPRIYIEGNLDYFAMAPIRFNPLVPWNSVSALWGDPAIRWNSVDYLNASKRMHRRAKRATHLQLSLASAEVTIQQSTSASSEVIVDSVSTSISLATPSVYAFDLNYEGHRIKINNIEYAIINGGVSTLIVEDPNNTLVDGQYAYEIIGKPKSQRPQISDIAVVYELFGDMDKLDNGIS